MYPITLVTGTASPAGCTIFKRTPESSASISILVLSDMISSKISPSWTLSPWAFFHSRISPSCISTPSFGILISFATGHTSLSCRVHCVRIDTEQHKSLTHLIKYLLPRREHKAVAHQHQPVSR